MKLRSAAFCRNATFQQTSRFKNTITVENNSAKTLTQYNVLNKRHPMKLRTVKLEIKSEPDSDGSKYFSSKTRSRCKPKRRCRARKPRSQFPHFETKALKVILKQFTDPAEKREIERNNKIRLIKSEVSGIIYVKSFDHKSKPTVPMPIITISNEMPCKIKQIHTPNTIDVDTNTNGKGSLNMPKDSSLSVNWNDFTTEVAADIQNIDSCLPVPTFTSSSSKDSINEAISISAKEDMDFFNTEKNFIKNSVVENDNIIKKNNIKKKSITDLVRTIIDRGLAPPMPAIGADSILDIFATTPHFQNISVSNYESNKPLSTNQKALAEEVICDSIEATENLDPKSRHYHTKVRGRDASHMYSTFQETIMENDDYLNQSASLDEYTELVRSKCNLLPKKNRSIFDLSDEESNYTYDDEDSDTGSLLEDYRSDNVNVSKPRNNQDIPFNWKSKGYTYSQRRSILNSLKEFVQCEQPKEDIGINEIFNNVCHAYLEGICLKELFCQYTHKLPSPEEVLTSLRKATVTVVNSAFNDVVLNNVKILPLYFDVFAEYYGETKNRTQLREMSQHCKNPQYNLLYKLKSVINGFVKSGLMYDSCVEQIINNIDIKVNIRDFNYLFDIILDERNARAGEQCSRFVHMFCSDELNFVVEYINRALQLCNSIGSMDLVQFCLNVLNKCTITTFRSLNEEALHNFIEYVEKYKFVDHKKYVLPLFNKMKQFHGNTYYINRPNDIIELSHEDP